MIAQNSIGNTVTSTVVTNERHCINKLVLGNFKKFNSLTLPFGADTNILAGDNEAGKSSILLAIDLTLSASKSKIEVFGLESLMSKNAVQTFLAGAKHLSALPALFVELYLSDCGDPDLHGRCNSLHENTFGLRLSCEPSDDYLGEITEVLKEQSDNFPFEFYAIKFATFSGAPYSGHRKPLRHLFIDSAQINADLAQRDHTRTLYRSHATPSERGKHENRYRQIKEQFRNDNLVDLNAKLPVKFQVRSSSKSNLENDLVIVEDGVPLEARGRGRQALIKTEFALRKGKGPDAIEILLLEEPENHLSHISMRRLLDNLSNSCGKQMFLSTHSSLVCSRLDLRKVLMIDAHGNSASLRDLDVDTADFFCKAPDNNVLEFSMSTKVILVEGDAEFVLISALYEACSGSKLERDGVHVIAVGGTSFKRYLTLAKTLKIRTAVVRDNDRDYQKHCADNYVGLLTENSKVFADKDNARWTFEMCLYEDNKPMCDELFANARRSLSVLDWMLDNKAEASLSLLKNYGATLTVPEYLRQAIEWVRQ